MSRRDFMKMSAAAFGTMAVGGQLITPQRAAAGVLGSQELASHVTIGNTSLQTNLNPYYFAYFQARQVYDTLIDVTPGGELIPGLATEWSRIDETAVELKLRDDVFFSNGERFTANSVAFTLNFLLTEGAARPDQFAIPLSDFVLFPPQFALFNLDSVEVIDDTNVIIKATRPDPILEKQLSRMFILSEQFLAENDNDMSTAAAGTGYFQVAEFVPGERIEYETWEGNWRGEYPLQSATYVRVGDVRTALESGDIDIAQSLPPDIARTMVNSGNWDVTSKPSLSTEFISMLADTHPALQDVRVRRALNLAIDKDIYNEVIQAGFSSTPTGQLLQPGLDGYNPDLEGFAYDPDQARALLEEAGYADLELTMLAANTIRAQAEAVASFYEAIGIRISLNTPDTGTVINEARAGTEYNLLLWNAFYTTLQDWSQAMIGIINPIPGSQIHFDDDEFLRLNGQINGAQDAETRNALIQDAAAVMNEKAGLVFLSWNDFFYVHSPTVTDLPLNLDNSPRLYAIEKLA